MTYNPNIHHRRSIRLKGYDYSQAGLYFITICVQNRVCLFGNVFDSKMMLNDAGQMIVKWYNELGNKYPDKKCHEMVVMPNHFHCIIENAPITDNHGTDAHGTDAHGTDAHGTDAHGTDAHIGASLRGRPKTFPRGHPEYGMNNKKYNATIGDAMDWFKTMTTNEYIRGVKIHNWERFYKKFWQRNYWEHIIRNEAEYNRIANYIIKNPAKWNNDKLNPKNPG
jgi:putative transposase